MRSILNNKRQGAGPRAIIGMEAEQITHKAAGVVVVVGGASLSTEHARPTCALRHLLRALICFVHVHVFSSGCCF